MVGNPYPCTIDWNTSYSGTGITTVNVNPTIYEYDPVTNQYDTYITTSAATGTATGNGSRYIMSGQGFFVQANNTGASLMFTEAAKAPTQLLTGGTLLMGNPTEQVADSQLLRLNLSVDSLNHDDIAFTFNSSASPKYNFKEDAAYIQGNNAPEGLSSFSDDSVRLAINSLPLPKLTPKVIRLSVDAAYTGTYTFQRTALNAIPQLYEIWLMDKLKKDSLDIRNNSTYTFDVDVVDTTTYGNNRFELVIRQNPTLMVHLLNFTGSKITDGSQIVWKTENEQNYTNFTVERSIDGGTTFTILGGFPSSALSTYSFLDKNPSVGADMYRLKMEDLNGTITYSNVVTLMYANTANTLAGNIIVYPNPTGNVINLTINQVNNANFVPGLSALQNFSNIPGLNNASNTNLSYGIKIINITGSVVKSATFSQANWRDDVGSFSPGTYIIQVINNKDNSIVGKSSFVKL
jgi:trimeric autotransporter adhesin